MPNRAGSECVQEAEAEEEARAQAQAQAQAKARHRYGHGHGHRQRHGHRGTLRTPAELPRELVLPYHCASAASRHSGSTQHAAVYYVKGGGYTSEESELPR